MTNVLVYLVQISNLAMLNTVKFSVLRITQLDKL